MIEKLNLQRQSFLGADSEIVLSRSRAALVGLGGGGSHVAQQLAHIGLGNFLLIDPDIIEDTNLNRLVGATQEDVKLGVPKVDIAERVIRGVNPSAEVVKRKASWTEVTAELRDVDVIFACVDSMICRSELESCCATIPDSSDRYRDGCPPGRAVSFQLAAKWCCPCRASPACAAWGWSPIKTLANEAAKYGVAGGKPQVVWPNGTLASIAVGFFMKLMTPWESQKETPLLLEHDGDLQTVMPSNKLAYLPAHCDHFDSLHEIGDPFWTSDGLAQLHRSVEVIVQRPTSDAISAS